MSLLDGAGKKFALGSFEHARVDVGNFLTPRGGQFVMTLCGRNAVQIAPAVRKQIDFSVLAEQLRVERYEAGVDVVAAVGQGTGDAMADDASGL